MLYFIFLIISGVILNDDLVNLLSVAAHNVVHAHLLSELSAPNAVITCLCSKAGDYLQEAMKCSMFLMVSYVSQENVLHLHQNQMYFINAHATVL